MRSQKGVGGVGVVDPLVPQKGLEGGLEIRGEGVGVGREASLVLLDLEELGVMLRVELGVEEEGVVRGLGMMGIVSLESGEIIRLGGLLESEDWREETRLDWKLERELMSCDSKSVKSATMGSKQGVAEPALVLSTRVSLYILERLSVALWSPS